MRTPFNFSAGPAVLPVPVLEEARDDMLSYKCCGMSVMELSHRGPEFMDIIARAEADLRALLSIPDSYDVLFLQGGASGQFAALPLNLTGAKEDVVDYIVTGSWSKKVRNDERNEERERERGKERGRAGVERPPREKGAPPLSKSHLHETPRPSLPLLPPSPLPRPPRRPPSTRP